MANIALDEPRPLPTWLKIGGSVVVIMHLVVFACLALGSQSGPWPTPMGPSMAEGPQFVRPVVDLALPNYLQPLRMTHNYHFMTNNTSQAGVYFEVHLKDKAGTRIKTLKFPDEKANPWIRHRQSLLAQGLAQDQSVPPPQGEVIAAAKQKVEMMIWEPSDNELRLKRIPQHLVPRDRPVMTPSEWSLTLAKTYARFLCRLHHADTAEIVRHSRDAWQPGYLFIPTIPPNETLVCNFGEYSRD